jgi:hypothetical protein
VKLRREEDGAEKQSQNANALRLGLHVLTKTKLRWEWLRGQASKPFFYMDLHTVLGYSMKTEIYGAHGQR